MGDLILSWNYPNRHCCHWHAGCNHLGELLQEIRSYRSCIEEWPRVEPSWQCKQCFALQIEDSDVCWLCCEPSHTDTLLSAIDPQPDQMVHIRKTVPQSDQMVKAMEQLSFSEHDTLSE